MYLISLLEERKYDEFFSVMSQISKIGEIKGSKNLPTYSRLKWTGEVLRVHERIEKDRIALDDESKQKCMLATFNYLQNQKRPIDLPHYVYKAYFYNVFEEYERQLLAAVQDGNLDTFKEIIKNFITCPELSNSEFLSEKCKGDIKAGHNQTILVQTSLLNFPTQASTILDAAVELKREDFLREMMNWSGADKNSEAFKAVKKCKV